MITIWLPDGRPTLAMRVFGSTFVEEVKAQIEIESGIPQDQQRLTTGNHQLEGGKTMKDYNISDGTCIWCMMSISGGGWFATKKKIDKKQEAKDKEAQQEAKAEKEKRMKLLAKEIELELEKWKSECINEAVLMQLKLEINKSNKDKGDPIKRAIENMSTSALSAAKESYCTTNVMTSRMRVLARIMYHEQMQLLDKKIKVFQHAQKCAEMNAQFIYEKLYSGKQVGKGETLAEVMNQVLTEKISGKKADETQDVLSPHDIIRLFPRHHRTYDGPCFRDIIALMMFAVSETSSPV